jgi:hypothetical protein
MRIFDFYERIDDEKRPCPGAKNMPLGWRIMAVICVFENAIRNFFRCTFLHKQKIEP